MANRTNPTTTVDFRALKCITGQLQFGSTVPITTIRFDALETLGTLTLGTNPATSDGITNLATTFPALITIGSFAISRTNISTISLPTLKYLNAGSSGTQSTLSAGTYTTFSFPALLYFWSIAISSSTSLTTISFPALVGGGTFTASSGNGAITTVTMGTIGTLKRMYAGVTVNLSGQAMSSATVNAILALYASLDGTNGTTAWASGTINVSGGTNGAPTGQGITDKATCQARGLTVTTN